MCFFCYSRSKFTFSFFRKISQKSDFLEYLGQANDMEKCLFKHLQRMEEAVFTVLKKFC